ncbi:MAG: hypothetical protein R3290_02800 [Acidimicrobiia bacterium]|nr:hypothetical protein [Acidimicrobiia bacterium]
MLLRLIVLVAVVGALWLALELSRRRVGGRSGEGLRPGLTLFVGPDCAICPRAREALEAHGAVIYDAVMAPDPRFSTHGIRSLPTALVAEADGTITMRRAGPTVIADAGDLVAEHRRITQDPLEDPV